MNCFFYLKLEDAKTVIRAWSAALLRILLVLKNVRGLITEHVLTYAHGKMPGGFADIAGITARTQKFEYHTRKRPTRDRIFHIKHVTDFKKTNLISMLPA